MAPSYKSSRRIVKPFWWPPTLLARQGLSAIYLGYLTGWKKLPRWLAGSGIRCLPGAGGSIGMGCIGFPYHPVWEVTKKCNLNCVHCHSSQAGKESELTTEEGRQLLRQLAQVDEFRMVAFTGGEPLLRDDIFDLLEHSQELGFANTLATNGTLVDGRMARELERLGVSIAAVSLDGDPETHDHIRGKPGAYQSAMRGMEAIAEAGIALHVNITLMDRNIEQLESLNQTLSELGATIALWYQIIPVGRAAIMEKSQLDRAQHRKFIEFLAEAQKDADAIMEPVAGPQYWPYLLESGGRKGRLEKKLAEYLFHGCSAGWGFAYIRPNGDVLPCPFIDITCGNVREESFNSIWRESNVLQNLRDRENLLKGRCGDCQYMNICGGCRARALATNGDYLSEDPLCFIQKEQT